MAKMYRQGDVVFLRLEDKQVAAIKEEFKKPVSLVLKEGEQTGHKHEAVGAGVGVFDARDKTHWSLRSTSSTLNDAFISREVLASTLYLTSAGQFKVVHPEHGTLTMEKGDYLVFSQREYDERQNRFVAD